MGEGYDYLDYSDQMPYFHVMKHHMKSGTWTVAEAKAKFSELIERARSRGPQTITRNGHTAAVVVSAEEWSRKTKRSGNLAEFFAASPLVGSDLKIERIKGGTREIDL